MSSDSPSTIWLGWDVHKASVTSAVLRDAAAPAECVDRLPNALPRLERYMRRWQREGTARVVYEASSAGFVLKRACAAWGVACDVIAPSLIPHARACRASTIARMRYSARGSIAPAS
jgi:transposase